RRVYQRLLPGGDLLAILHRIVPFFARDPLGYRVMVELAEGEAPRLRLSRLGEKPPGPDGWLGLGKQKTWGRTFPVPSENKPQAIAASLAQAWRVPAVA